MYEDFVATDRWTGEQLHCVWKATVVAIATRHADATDIRFAVNDRPLWIAMPNTAWLEQKRRNDKVITDYIAAQTAGRFLKQSIENGYDNGREMVTMTVDEVLEHAEAVVRESKGSLNAAVAARSSTRTLIPAEMDFPPPSRTRNRSPDRRLAERALAAVQPASCRVDS